MTNHLTPGGWPYQSAAPRQSPILTPDVRELAADVHTLEICERTCQQIEKNVGQWLMNRESTAVEAAQQRTARVRIQLGRARVLLGNALDAADRAVPDERTPPPCAD